MKVRVEFGHCLRLVRHPKVVDVLQTATTAQPRLPEPPEGLNFKLLADTDHKVSSAYGSLTNLGVVKFASRHTFLINPEGQIVKVFTDVNPSKHSEEVLSALSELLAQSPATRK